jgi:hypothetical protein
MKVNCYDFILDNKIDRKILNKLVKYDFVINELDFLISDFPIHNNNLYTITFEKHIGNIFYFLKIYENHITIKIYNSSTRDMYDEFYSKEEIFEYLKEIFSYKSRLLKIKYLIKS